MINAVLDGLAREYRADEFEAKAVVIVREAAGADESAVVALWRACGLVAGTNDPVAEFRLALAGPTSTVLVGATPDGAIAGAVMVGHDGHRGWLYYVGRAAAANGHWPRDGGGRRAMARRARRA